MSGNAGTSRRTSHSTDALHVPGTSAAWPPFAQTTAVVVGSPWNLASAPVESRVGDRDATRERYPCAGAWLRRPGAKVDLLGEVSERPKERDWKSRTW